MFHVMLSLSCKHTLRSFCSWFGVVYIDVVVFDLLRVLLYISNKEFSVLFLRRVITAAHRDSLSVCLE